MTYTTLRDLTIEDYIKIVKIVDTFKDNDNKVREEFIKHFKLEKLDINELDETLLNINEILKHKPNFIQRFELDGVKYGFIPNLDNITAGEWIDIENYQSSVDYADRLVSILYRPIKRSLKFWKRDYYQIEEYKGTNDKLRKAPLEVYLGAMVFFYHLGKTLLEHIDTSIKTMSPKQKEAVSNLVQKHTFNKSLDGIV